jgi:hypothetical protein
MVCQKRKCHAQKYKKYGVTEADGEVTKAGSLARASLKRCPYDYRAKQ